MEQNPNHYSIDDDLKLFLEQKYRYAQKLTNLLEDIKTAALGIDKQSQRELYQLERKVTDKLLTTKKEVAEVIKQHQSALIENKSQEKLFDV